MNRKKLMSKIMTAVIAGGVLLSTGSYAFAKSNVDGITNPTKKTQEAKMHKKNSTDNIKPKLDKLVTAKTITQAQEDSILSAMKQEKAEKKAEMDKVKNLPEADRKAYFENKKTTEKGNFLDKLITDGTLTGDQATAVKNVLHKGSGRKENGANPKRFKEQLDKLVTAGTITKTEETNILTHLTEKQAERKTEMDKVKNMTKAERKTYFESKKTTEKDDFFKELVTSGIISQNKANAIKSAMPTPKDHGMKHHSVKTN